MPDSIKFIQLYKYSSKIIVIGKNHATFFDGLIVNFCKEEH